MTANCSSTATVSFLDSESGPSATESLPDRTVRYRSEPEASALGGSSTAQELRLRLTGVRDVRLTSASEATAAWTYVNVLLTRELIQGSKFQIGDHEVTATVIAVDGDDLGAADDRVRVELAALVSVDPEGGYVPGPDYLSEHVDVYLRVASNLARSAVATIVYEVFLTGRVDVAAS